MTQLTWILISRQLSQHQTRLHVDLGNAEWDSSLTESLRNDKFLVNTGTFHVDSVDMESHSALNQLTLGLTQRWLSWQGLSLRFDSVCRKWARLVQANITIYGAFKRTKFRKLIHETFKLGSLLIWKFFILVPTVASSKKILSVIESTRSNE